MADLALQRIPQAGLQPTYAAAAAAGDTAPIGTHCLLAVKNGSEAEVTVTVAVNGDLDGLAVEDAALAIPAAGDALVPLRPIYRDATTGRAAITYSAHTDVTVAALQLP